MKTKILTFLCLIGFTTNLNSSVVSFPRKNPFSKKELKIAMNKLSNHKNNDQIASLVIIEAKKLNLDPKILLAIIKVESNFNQKAVSSTGDFSMAQINYNVWQKEFKRLNMSKIDKKKLKKDYVYSIKMMGKILTILKERHSKNDTLWFARYHSSTNSLKNRYYDKMKIHLNDMNTAISNDFIKNKKINPVY